MIVRRQARSLKDHADQRLANRLRVLETDIIELSEIENNLHNVPGANGFEDQYSRDRRTTLWRNEDSFPCLIYFS